MILEIILIIIAFVLVMAGAIGVLIPMLPSTPVAWLGLLLFGYATDFSFVGLTIILVFLGLILLTMAIDTLGPVLGAKKYKASKWGILGCFAGVILGGVVAGPIGVILGPFVGAFLGEFINSREPQKAMTAVKGVFVGNIISGAVKLAVIFSMFGFMVYALFR